MCLLSGNVSSEKVKTVWICGDSLVALSRRLLKSPEWGIELGSPSMRVYWYGKEGMKWKELIPRMLKQEERWPFPDLLLVHLGGDSIPVRPEDQLRTIRNILTSAHIMHPRCLIVWSDILARCPGKRHMTTGVGDKEEDKPAEQTHDVINHRVHTIVTELGGRVITHENIGPELFCPKGISLTDQGIQRFNLNIQKFLDQWDREVKPALKQKEPIPLSPELTWKGPELPRTFQGPELSKPGYFGPADRSAIPLNPAEDALDVPPKDARNTLTSRQQSQKVNQIPLKL